jgi:ABC-2 type transport system ATP-binding protein
MIHIDSLSKRFGSKIAVDDITATIQSGRVTGFLGPNGAGKSTTMRMIMGLDHPSGGYARINGKSYADLESPLVEVGALLDPGAVQKGRTAYNHLRAMAATHSIPKRRVHEVIGLAGLESVAGKRVAGYSLGMAQRLGIAGALLGDPETLILDEPVNGLDPEGVLWVRQLLRSLAAEGRTVFLSSHLMSEMAQTADHLIVLGRGRIVADAPIDSILTRASRHTVRVQSPQVDQLAQAIAATGVTISSLPDQRIEVTGLTSAQISDAAARAGIAVHELTPITASLEDAYLELTHDEVEYRTEETK